ncbi:MAG: hypothetical protein AB8W37_02430 [Arsenophonus endosymbiont of Dermacentor nuttalli]
MDTHIRNFICAINDCSSRCSIPDISLAFSICGELTKASAGNN